MLVTGDNRAHILLFPYPMSGHVIPMLDFTKLLLNRGLTVTILATPPNLPLLEPLISNYPFDSLQTLVLSFPDPPISPENNLAAKIRASSALFNPIFQWFQSHPSPPVVIISDFFLGWTHNLAARLGVPRVAFWTSGALSSLILSHIWHNVENIINSTNENSMISFPTIPNSPIYPRWQVCQLSSHYKEGDPDWEFLKDSILANTQSWGVVFNSFQELEGVYIDHVNKQMGHDRVWAVGPLLPTNDNIVKCFNRGGTSVVPQEEVLTWLDNKADNSVIYVCFGTRVMLTSEQIDALAAGLECSRVHFVWCLRTEDQACVAQEYENGMAGRGIIIRGWAPQVAILRHKAVGAFLTHCGWNSILEGLAAGVVMLTWPMGADQFSNAKLLVDELGVAMEACEGGTRTVPDIAKLAYIFAEAVGGKQPKMDRVLELRDAAIKVVQNGGSSIKDLDGFLKQLKELKLKK